MSTAVSVSEIDERLLPFAAAAPLPAALLMAPAAFTAVAAPATDDLRLVPLLLSAAPLEEEEAPEEDPMKVPVIATDGH